jgi:Na+/H+-dicarboxylate symporter
MAAGLLGGVAAFRWPGAGWNQAIEILEPFGAVWLAALQMLTLPLMVSMLLVTVGRAGTGQASRLGWWTLSWCLAFLGAAAIVTVLVGQSILDWFPLDDASRAAFRGAIDAGGTAGPPPAVPTVRDWLVNLVPANLIRAAADGALLPLIIATLLFGAALRSVPGRGRELLLDLAQAVSDWCFTLAGLLFRALPFAVFVLTMVSTARSGASMVSALVYYVVVISALLAAGIFVLYPLTAWLGQVGFGRFAKALWPVQMLAFSTRSSLACLPAMLDAARRGLQLPEPVLGFTLPFAVSTFKLNMAISANFQMLFLLHLYGLHPDPAALGVGVLALTLQSFATPGLPSGAIWTTTPVYLALGIPLEGVVLTNVVDTIPDLFKTVANVSGNMSIAAIVARRWRRETASR